MKSVLRVVCLSALLLLGACGQEAAFLTTTIIDPSGGDPENDNGPELTPGAPPQLQPRSPKGSPPDVVECPVGPDFPGKYQ